MGRRPWSSTDAAPIRGAWSAEEDATLSEYVRVHGPREWKSLPQRAGLNRCGKSCRLRWLNYLRPDIKRGSISPDEEDLILKLHRLLGNRWSLIAARLPGRTDNEIKNHWNSYLSKRVSHEKTPPKHPTKSAVPLVGDRLFKPTPRRVAKRCTNNVIPALSNPQDSAATNNLESWRDLVVEGLMTDHDSEFMDLAPTDNIIDLESVSMQFGGHSQSACLWCWNEFSSWSSCGSVNDFEIVGLESSPGDDTEFQG